MYFHALRSRSALYLTPGFRETVEASPGQVSPGYHRYCIGSVHLIKWKVYVDGLYNTICTLHCQKKYMAADMFQLTSYNISVLYFLTLSCEICYIKTPLCTLQLLYWTQKKNWHSIGPVVLFRRILIKILLVHDVCKIKSPPWKRLSAVLDIYNRTTYKSYNTRLCTKKYLTKAFLNSTHQFGMTILLYVILWLFATYSIIYFLFSWTGSISLTICRTTSFLHRKKGKSSSHSSHWDTIH